MQAITIGASGSNIIRNALAKSARPRRPKLHLPLALANKPAAETKAERATGLSPHELRRIVAGVIG